MGLPHVWRGTGKDVEAGRLGGERAGENDFGMICEPDGRLPCCLSEIAVTLSFALYTSRFNQLFEFCGITCLANVQDVQDVLRSCDSDIS